MADQAKRALVTGGGSGIGLAIARNLAANGAEVTIAGRNVDRLKSSGLPYIEMDVTDDAAVVAGIKEAGPIDIFIANAGSAVTAPALKTTREIWDDMIALNLTSAYLCAREAMPPMIERGWGRFISIASTASLRAYPYTAAYTAAKHGLLGWIKTLAIENAQTGVTVNAVCPGFTDTPMVEDAVQQIMNKTGRSREVALKTFTGANPMQRLVTPDEIAACVLWLTSESAASVNGQAIIIDGGETSE